MILQILDKQKWYIIYVHGRHNMMLSDMYCYIVWWIVIPHRIQFDLQLFVYSHAPNIL